MTRQIINTGSAANDGTGDSLRSGADKINQNFSEIYEKFGTSDVLSSRIEFDSDEILIQGVSNFKTSIGVVNPSQDNYTLIPDYSPNGIQPSYFVLDSAPQTLRNKILDSATLITPLISDASEDHEYIFAPSELSADRIITLPLLTTNDTFVFEDHTQTLINKTFDSCIANNLITSDFILNPEGDPMLFLDDQGAATPTAVVNYLKIGNAVSGNDVDIVPDGADANINLRIRGKGNKSVLFSQRVAFDNETLTVSGGSFGSAIPLSIQDDVGGTLTKGLEDGTATGQIKYIHNNGNYTLSITGNISGISASLDVDSAVVEFMWMGSEWHVINQGHPKITFS